MYLPTWTTMRLRSVVAAAIALAPTVVFAQPVSLNGQIGAEWNGITSILVGYDPNAPQGNFGAPTNKSSQTSYEIFTRRDANYLYTAFRTTNGMTSGGNLFTNLYFSLRSGPGMYGTTGSSIGFEVTNNRAFKPGDPTNAYFSDNANDLIQFATSSGAGNPDIIETAINLTAFTQNALGVTGYVPDPFAIGIRLNLSQTFGNSVAGGSAAYGDQMLGFVSLATVPEPSTYALMAAGLAAMGMVARRRKSRLV